jgi:hypothetical protein
VRSTVSIDDDGPLPGKTLENAPLNRLQDQLDALGVVMSRQAYEDVDLTYVDELAKKIIC